MIRISIIIFSAADVAKSRQFRYCIFFLFYHWKWKHPSTLSININWSPRLFKPPAKHKFNVLIKLPFQCLFFDALEILFYISNCQSFYTQKCSFYSMTSTKIMIFNSRNVATARKKKKEKNAICICSRLSRVHVIFYSYML